MISTGFLSDYSTTPSAIFRPQFAVASLAALCCQRACSSIGWRWIPVAWINGECNSEKTLSLYQLLHYFVMFYAGRMAKAHPAWHWPALFSLNNLLPYD
jgi:hypothetical protein